jgi:hypothetical protein
MGIYTKIKWILGILIVFVIIVCTNLIDRNNFIRVKDAVVTIYEDRLIANDLIFEMSRRIQTKEIAYVSADSAFFNLRNATINEELNTLVDRYAETKLTAKELTLFEALKSHFQRLFDLENQQNQTAVKEELQAIKSTLHRLSKVQLDEGSKQMTISKRAIGTVELFTDIEIYLLAFLAIVIQIIIMYNPKKKA